MGCNDIAIMFIFLDRKMSHFVDIERPIWRLRKLKINNATSQSLKIRSLNKASVLNDGDFTQTLTALAECRLLKKSANRTSTKKTSCACALCTRFKYSSRSPYFFHLRNVAKNVSIILFFASIRKQLKRRQFLSLSLYTCTDDYLRVQSCPAVRLYWCCRHQDRCVFRLPRRMLPLGYCMDSMTLKPTRIASA